MDRILFDTNVLLDVLDAREPFLASSLAVLTMAQTGTVKGATTGLSLAIIAYIKRKEPVEKVARTMITLREFLAVANLGEKEVDLALSAGFSDLEDAFQWEAANGWRATHLVTRNVADFPGSGALKVLSPAEYLRDR